MELHVVKTRSGRPRCSPLSDVLDSGHLRLSSSRQTAGSSGGPSMSAHPTARHRTLWAIALVAAISCRAPAPSAPSSAPASAPAAPTAAPADAGTSPTPGALPPPLDPPQMVHVGLLQAISDAGVYIGLDRGYYRDLGLDLQVETVPDPNTLSSLINTSQLDVGGPGVNLSPFLAAARGIGVKMVADKGQLRPGFGYVSVIVRQDLLDSGEVRSFADLRGRTLAKAAPCDAGDPPIQHGLDRAGLTRDDVDIVHLSFPDMNTALANHALDAAWQLEPLIALADQQGIARKLVGGDELYPNQEIGTLYYSPEFAKRVDAARRFMVAYVRGLRDYNDAFGKNVGRAAVVQILAKYTTVKDPSLYDKMIPAGLDPNGRINLQGMRDNLAVWTRLGCVTGEVADVS